MIVKPRGLHSLIHWKYLPATQHAKCTLRGSAFSTAVNKTGSYASLTVNNDIGIIKVNSPGKLSVFSPAVANDVLELFKEIEQNPKLVGSVFACNNYPNSLVLPEVNKNVKSPGDGYQLSKLSHKFTNDLKRFKKPTVAAIIGTCTGGELEACLSCDYRIAVQEKSSFSFSEVLTGLIPGGGGTYVMPKLIGLPNALDMLLTGRTITAAKAKSIGLIDNVITSLGPGLETPDQRTLDYILEVAVDTSRKLAHKKMQINREPKGIFNRVTKTVLGIKYVRNYIFDQALKKVKQQTRGLYPAPLKLIEVIREGTDKGEIAGKEAEANAFGQLLCSKESEGLSKLFEGYRNCKIHNLGDGKHPISTVGVLGSGLMGAGIANISIQNGYKTILRDLSEENLAKAQAGIEKYISKSIKRRKISKYDGEIFISRLIPTTHIRSFSKADIVIEAVFEDIQLKHKVIKELEEIIPEHCVIATNTSALPITQIAEASKRPEKVVGMHYFSPVEKMELLEIVKTKSTSKETLQKSLEVALKQKKTPIIVEDGPGFYTTRVIMSMVAEGFRLILEGANPEKIDNLAMDLGFPVGPVVLADEVGIDVGYHVYLKFVKEFGARFDIVPEQCGADITAAGFLGRKVGKGYYIYHKNSKKKTVNEDLLKIIERHRMQPKMPLSDENIKSRLIYRFVNEALLCLQEGIISNPQDGDVGAVFGLGFPPFTGGPFHYVDSNGADKIVSKMREIEAVYGSSFTPCQILQDHAKNTTENTFYKK